MQLASKRQGEFPPVFPAHRVEEEAPEETQREEVAKVAKEAAKAAVEKVVVRARREAGSKAEAVVCSAVRPSWPQLRAGIR